MSDLMRASRDAARAIARMNGSGRANGSDQRGMAWGTVVSVKGQFVDVMIGGTVSGSLRYTTACDGMAEGDRVMVQYVGHEPIVVGIVSDGAKPAKTDYEIETVDSSITNHGSNICKVVGGVAYYSTNMSIGSFGSWDSKTALSGFPGPSDGMFVGGMATPQGSTSTPIAYYLDSSNNLILTAKGGSSGVTNGWIWLSLAYPVASSVL